VSLVNDALKRATEAQKSRPPVPVVHLPLRPVEAAKQNKTGIGLVLPATLLTIIVVALFSLRLARRADQNTPPPPPQTTAPAEKNISKPAAAILDLAPGPLAVSAKEIPAPVPAPPAVVPAPQPAPLKLQAVFYSPPHPSAIISGKTVRVGDVVRELQVVAIGSSSALLISATQTNFLTLE
jgi:hypothetical protein